MTRDFAADDLPPPRVIVVAALALAGVCFVSAPSLVVQSGWGHGSVLAAFGALLALLALLMALGRVGPVRGGALTMLLFGAAIAMRIAGLFWTDYFDNRANSFLMPVFAYLPLFYLLAFLLLPLRQALPVAIAGWLAVGLSLSLLTLPYWHEQPLRSSLPALLSLVWLGNGLFVLMFGYLMQRRGRAQAEERRALEMAEGARQALAESEHRFRGLFDQAAVGIAILRADGRWLNVNQRLCEITGYSERELLARDFQSITHPDDLDRDQAQADAVVAGTLHHYRLEKRYIRRDGSQVWVMLHVSRIDATDTAPMYFVAVIEDLTEQKAAEARAASLSAELEAKVVARTAQLRESLESWKLRGVELNAIAEMGGFLSAARDSQEASRLITSYLPRLFPYAQGDLYLEDKGGDGFQRSAGWGVGGTGQASFHREDCWCLRRGQDYRVQVADGMPRCPHLGPVPANRSYLCVPLIAAGEAIGVLSLGWGADAVEWEPDPAMLGSVTKTLALAIANLRLREELHRQVIRDSLTGLYNRRFFDESLAKRHARGVRGGEGYSLLMIDIDHFKAINDQYGHDAGDAVLQQIGAGLNDLTRSDELAFRYGGEEFAMITEAADLDAAAKVAERIRLHLGRARVVHKGAFLPPVTVSIGVAVGHADLADPQQLVVQADQALYEAKVQGRDRVCLASGEGSAGIQSPRTRRLRPVSSAGP